MFKRVLIRAVYFTLIMVAAAGAVSTASAQTRKDREQVNQLIREGDRAFDQKNYAIALEKYTQAIALFPAQIPPNAKQIREQKAYTHYRKGFVHYYLKEYAEAIPEFDNGLNLGYKPLEISRVRWYPHYALKNYDLALADLNLVIAAEPNNMDVLIAAANVNFDKGDFVEAANAYRRAINKSPNNGDLYYRLALSRSKSGDIDGQASAAEDAIRRNTSFLADSWLLLAAARHTQKRAPEAIEAYNKALASKPDKYEAYRELAELYRSQSQITEAIDISKAALRRFPNDGNIYTDLSWFYSLAGRTDDAIAAGRSATQLLPTKYLGYTNLCRAYYEGKKPELAVGACNSALRLQPEDGETLFYLGRASNDLGKTADADKFYRRALVGLLEYTKNNPDYSDGFYLLGNTYAEVGQNAKAIEAYKKCLELNPRFTKANFNIGIIQIIEKNKAGALEQYNALLQTDKALAEKLKAEIDKL